MRSRSFLVVRKSIDVRLMFLWNLLSTRCRPIVMSSPAGRRRLVINLDLNKTIMFTDPASGLDLRSSCIGTISYHAWGGFQRRWHSFVRFLCSNKCHAFSDTVLAGNAPGGSCPTSCRSIRRLCLSRRVKRL